MIENDWEQPRHAKLVNGEIVPVTLLEWARSFETADRKVAFTEIGDIRISTVFLGLDHSYGDGPPLWFETMTFGGEHDNEQDRYTTLEEAMRGHDRMVAMVTDA